MLGVIVWLLLPKVRANISSTRPPVRLTVEEGNARYPALSSDGKLMAYASDRNGNFDIFLRQLSGSSDIQLTKSLYNEIAPTFTPDGQYIVLQSDEPDAELQVVPALGGERRILATKGKRPKVSPNGQQVLFWTSLMDNDLPGPTGRIMVVPFAGGAPRILQENRFLGASHPVWLGDKQILFRGLQTKQEQLSSPNSKTDREPIGRSVGIFAGKAADRATAVLLDWWVCGLDDAPAQPIRVPEALQLLDPGRWGTMIPAFANDEAVYGWAQVGDADQVFSVHFDRQNPQTGSTAKTVFHSLDRVEGITASDKESMVYAVGNVNEDLYRLRFDPKSSRIIEPPEQLTFEPSVDRTGSLSDDGRVLAYLSDRGGSSAVWVRNLETRQDKRIASAQGPAMRISPDGRYVAFTAFKEPGKEFRMFVASTDRGSPVAIGSLSLVPSRWIEPHVLRTMATTEKQDATQFLDLSYPAGEIKWQSAWMPLDLRCEPWSRFVWCYSVNIAEMTNRLTAYPVGSPAPEHAVSFFDVDVKVPFISDDETAVYWAVRQNEGDVLWGRKVDQLTGEPSGEPFVVHRFNRRLRFSEINSQAASLRKGNLVITLRSETSNIWLQKLSPTP